MAWNDVGNDNNNGGSGVQTKYTKLKTGTTQGRILDEQPVSRWTHWIQQANGGKGLSVDCIGRDCPVCESIKTDKQANRKPKYTSRKQHAINWLNRDTGEVEILEQGQKVFGGLRVLLEQMGDLRNYDVKIIRTGETFNNIDYNVLPVFPPTALTEVEQSLDKFDTDSLKKSFTKEQIVALMSGATLDEVLGANNAEPETESSDSTSDDNISVDFTGDRVVNNI